MAVTRLVRRVLLVGRKRGESARRSRSRKANGSTGPSDKNGGRVASSRVASPQTGTSVPVLQAHGLPRIKHRVFRAFSRDRWKGRRKRQRWPAARHCFSARTIHGLKSRHRLLCISILRTSAVSGSSSLATGYYSFEFEFANQLECPETPFHPFVPLSFLPSSSSLPLFSLLLYFQQYLALFLSPVPVLFFPRDRRRC